MTPSDEEFLAVFRGGRSSGTNINLRCEKGSIRLKVSALVLDPTDYFGALPPATKVEVKITPKAPAKKGLTIKLTPREASELFDGKRPECENFDLIYRRICERKNHPLPEPEVPGGGRSYSVQGQTKKPGSHSHDKHR